MVNIYIASSAKDLKRQSAVVCLILENPVNKGKTTTLFGKVLESTKYRAELIALKNALMQVNKSQDLTIYTECQYLAAVFDRGWIHKWKANGWRTAKGKDVKNQEEFQKIDELLAGRTPTFKVKVAHEYYQWQQSEVKKRVEKYRKGQS